MAQKAEEIMGNLWKVGLGQEKVIWVNLWEDGGYAATAGSC